MNKWFWTIIIAWLLVSCVVDESENSPSGSSEIVRVGDRLPAFTVEVIDGAERWLFSSVELSGPTVIVFFNTSCSDCRRELPRLNEYYLKHREEEGFRMIAISREETASSIRAFWEAEGLSIPYSPQPDRAIYQLFATATIPRVYVCSASGIVTWIGIENFTLPDA